MLKILAVEPGMNISSCRSSAPTVRVLASISNTPQPECAYWGLAMIVVTPPGSAPSCCTGGVGPGSVQAPSSSAAAPRPVMINRVAVRIDPSP
jgi:hypothetical protein